MRKHDENEPDVIIILRRSTNRNSCIVLHDIFDRHQGSMPEMRAEAMRFVTRGLLSRGWEDNKPGAEEGEV